jgi:dihydrofolate reductase
MNQDTGTRTGRTLVVVNFVSLDGGIQSVLSADEDREGGFTLGGWVPPYADDVLASFMQRKTIEASGMVLGRKTYQGFAEVWPQADQSEPAVAAMTRMPKYVASRTDEYHLLTFPIVLGSGKRMFPELPAPLRLRLTDTVVTTTGVVINSYLTDD